MNTSPLPIPLICFPRGDYPHFDVSTKNFNLSAQAQRKEIEAKVSGQFLGIKDMNLGINFMMIRYNPPIISPIRLAKYLREHWPAN